MTLSQLRYAITVADSRSMNQAAQKLFISQPSLSAAIRELEDEVGIEIFRRTNRGIQVTPDGEEFVGYARQVVEQYALIEARYVDKEKVKKNEIDIYFLDYNKFKNIIKEINKNKVEILEYKKDNKLKANVKTEDKQNLETFIPYDKGWKIYVDGKKAEVNKKFDTFISPFSFFTLFTISSVLYFSISFILYNAFLYILTSGKIL